MVILTIFQDMFITLDARIKITATLRAHQTAKRLFCFYQTFPHQIEITSVLRNHGTPRSQKRSNGYPVNGRTLFLVLVCIPYTVYEKLVI